MIDAEAQAGIDRHIDTHARQGPQRAPDLPPACRGTQHGTFVPPTLIEIDSLAELEREVFGPVLHVLRYRREDLDAAARRDQCHRLWPDLRRAYPHRRDDRRVRARARAGNLYVNRNMIGAVVGVQPFGGDGLSGTGPKAGGPLYLYRLLSSRPADGIERSFARMGAHAPAPVDLQLRTAMQARQGVPLAALRDWAHQQKLGDLASQCDAFAELSQSGLAHALPGPTGERNTYRLLPRETVLGLADARQDRLCQLAAALAVGSALLWPDDELARALHGKLPQAVRARIRLVADWNAGADAFDAVLHHGDSDQLRAVCEQVARRPGPIVGVIGLARGETAIPLERLLIERAISVNTAAAGGNASLMTIG